MTVEERALRTVNAARVAFGFAPLTELPGGRRSNSEDCVLARALHGIGGSTVTVNEQITFGSEAAARWFATSENVQYLGERSHGRYSVQCPSHLRALYGAFDEGSTPEYSNPAAARSYPDRLYNA